MMKVLVCEGRSDAIVLRTVFAAADLNDVRILEGGGKSSAISLGTSIALNGGARVAILVDADTTDPSRLEEQQLIFDDLLGRSPDNGSCRLFLAVPTLEDAVFPTAADFASAFGVKLTPRQVERYKEDWNLVIRSFLTTPAANARTMIATKAAAPQSVRTVFEKPLMGNIKAFFEGE